MATEEMVCPGCATKNPLHEDFCIKCGRDLNPSTDSIPPPTEAQSIVGESRVNDELRFFTAASYPIQAAVQSVTHPGLSGKNNEDAVVTDGVDFPKHNIAVRFAIVADGMGGEKAGEVLAKQAVYDIAAGIWFLIPSFEQHLDFDKLDFWKFLNNQFENFLSAQVASANQRVRRYGAAKKLKSGSYGATVVLAVTICDLETGHIMVHGFNAGDARCYKIGQEITQLSEDHTIQGAPTQFLGAHEHLTGKAFKCEVPMSAGEQKSMTLVLCTDGLWNMLGPEDIRKYQDPEEMLQAALSVEIPHGRAFDSRVQVGDDNITIAVIHVSHISEQEKEVSEHVDTNAN